MHYPKAYIDYLIYFHAERDYFECHEVLEEYWKEHPSDPYKDVWHVCIQLAVTAYHERRGNGNGALKMLNQALERIEAMEASLLEDMGLDANKLKEMMREWNDKLSARKELEMQGNSILFQDPNLPIRDEELLQACKEEAARRGLTWLATGALDDFIIHKHTLRDRSEVIQARQAAWQQKRSSSER